MSMRGVDTQKACSGCGGRQAAEIKKCIYCGADFSKQGIAMTPENHALREQNFEEALYAGYHPPYAARAGVGDSMGAPPLTDPMYGNDAALYPEKKGTSMVPPIESVPPRYTPPPYKEPGAAYSPSVQPPYRQVVAAQPVQEDEMGDEQQSLLFPAIFLSVGSLAFVFGLILFTFGENGVLTCSWKTDHWWALCGVALPLMFFGYHKSKNLN